VTFPWWIPLAALGFACLLGLFVARLFRVSREGRELIDEILSRKQIEGELEQKFQAAPYVRGRRTA
jgi:hypothetical protein